MTKLVIVESPGKIKTVQKYLGNEYKVIASVGHILDLPSNKLSIDVENNFKPTYKNITGKATVIKNIKSSYDKCSDILIATDKDREGEMIAWSIAHILKLKNPKRLLFDSITKDKLLKAIKNPTKINDGLVNAQKARRLLDRLLGYRLSPVLWKNIGAKLSAGRVQSVVVKLICEKEEEINKFLNENLKSEYKTNGIFECNKNKYNSTLLSIKDDKTKPTNILEEKDAKSVMKKFIGSEFTADDRTKSKSYSSSGRPFTTSTLQQEAGNKLKMSVKKTMRSAQNLYENGLITYMRTDSVALSKDALVQIEKYIKANYSDKYYKKTVYKTKGNNTQEAHEAVRPTKIDRINVAKGGKIGSDEVRLYNLIWKRTIASQMSNAEYDVCKMNIKISKTKKYVFETVFKKLIFSGYLEVYGKTDDDTTMDIPKKGTKMKANTITCSQEFKNPPIRYNEVSLVKKLDPETGLNIGRPATYQNIITKIQDRNYVEKMDSEGKEIESLKFVLENDKLKKTKNKVKLGADKNRLVPTDIGKRVNKFLNDNFQTIMDYKFTANMETKLDDIESGKLKWDKVLKEFYDNFNPCYEYLIKNPAKDLITENKVLGKDPETGNNVIATIGYYGPMVKIEGIAYKTGPIRKPNNLDNITLKKALNILKFPKLLGKIGNADVFVKVSTKKGKNSYYLNVAQKNYPLESGELDLEKAKEIIENFKSNNLGYFKEGTKEYAVMKGKNGWKDYIRITDTKKKKYKINVPIPKGTDSKTLDLEKIKSIIEKKFKK